MPNIRFSHRPENGVGNGMAKDVRIGMACETTGMRNGDTSQNERAPFGKLVNVVT